MQGKGKPIQSGLKGNLLFHSFNALSLQERANENKSP